MRKPLKTSFLQFSVYRVINNPDASVGAQCSTFRTVCSIRWLQSALIPFVTTQSEQTAIQRRLLSMQDMQYRDFNSKLIPTVDPKLMIGIRTPLLRKFAKELFKTEPEQTAAFMHDLPHRYFEENNLHAFLIENIKDFNAAMDETEKFLPFIDNWADRA